MHSRRVNAGARKNRLLALVGAIVVAVILGIVITNMLLAVKVVEQVTVEAGGQVPAVSAFFKKEPSKAEFITDISSIPMNKPGKYDIRIQTGKKEYTSQLVVADTVAPQADAVNVEIWSGETKEATDFVTNIVDATAVAASFGKQPNFQAGGNQAVEVVLRDAADNTTTVLATLTVKLDTEAPVITGVENQTVFEGARISYRNNVTVTDNRDEKVELHIDNSAVNLKKVGTYEVVYSATDAAGNVGTATATIDVQAKPADYVDPDELNALADRVLEKILKDDMTDVDKAWAIFKWTKNNIGYVSSSEKGDWMKSAWRGLKKGTGDCYVYYGTAKLLLERVGFETQEVKRDGGRDTEHYWNLLFIEGGWYHFDTTPTIEKNTAFLQTDAELDKYSEKVKNYYKRDMTKNPATPENAPEERSKYL